MKKLINFALVLLAGIVLGYLFHDLIDTKLKAKFGNETVEKGKAVTKKGIENTYEVTKEITKSAIDTVKARNENKK